MEERLHPQSEALLRELGPPAKSFTPAGARAAHEAMVAWVSPPKRAVHAVDELEIPAGEGERFAALARELHGAGEAGTAGVPAGDLSAPDALPALRVRRYLPRPGADRALVYLHGGGWVQGTLDTYDGLCRALALEADAQVLSVDYRLSPECRFPGAIVDSARAFDWIRANAPALGLDPARIAIGGDSAGGHLAITAARWLKRAGAPLPAALALIYPVADRALDSGSARAFGEGFYLSRAQMDWFWQQFLGDRAIDPRHPDLSPAHADDLAGLPPALVMTAGCDILRDEGEALARRLAQAGVKVEAIRLAGMLHGFVRFGARIDDAAVGIAGVGEALRRWLA